MPKTVKVISKPSDDLLVSLREPTDWEAECGEPLGTGSYRRVFECKSDPTKVIKKARTGDPYCYPFHCLQSNWWEYKLWQYVSWVAESENPTRSMLYYLSQILCPIYRLSYCCTYSLAERATANVCPSNLDWTRWRDTLPPFFEDICRVNCGTLADGRYVVLDYGNWDETWFIKQIANLSTCGFAQTLMAGR